MDSLGRGERSKRSECVGVLPHIPGMQTERRLLYAGAASLALALVCLGLVGNGPRRQTAIALAEVPTWQDTFWNPADVTPLLMAGKGATGKSVQKTTVWNGDHVTNGGNKEWAEEDAALHAWNMQNWRNKILDKEIERQAKQWRLMHSLDNPNFGKKKAVEPVEAAVLSSSSDVPEAEAEVSEGTAQPKALTRAEQGLAREETAGDVAAENAEKIGEIMKQFGIQDSADK
uniref:Transmembrane protein n=1 Tax=Hemiselmis andersenii TaxID=464988 RepID=A0A6T8JX19_HEMAN